MEVGRLYRIESIILPDADDVNVALLPGVTVPIQLAAAGTSTIMVDPNFHHTDAGDGARTVLGSTRGDLILYGDGAKTIDGFLGDDIILPKIAFAAAAAPGVPAAPGPSGATPTRSASTAMTAMISCAAAMAMKPQRRARQ